MDQECLDCITDAAMSWVSLITSACYDFSTIFNGNTGTTTFDSNFCDPACRTVLLEYTEELFECTCYQELGDDALAAYQSYFDIFFGCGGQEVGGGFVVRITWTWSFTTGDPHFTTLDGLKYTFNGIGDYWLLKGKEDRYGVEVIGRFDHCPKDAGTAGLNATCTSKIGMKLGFGTKSAYGTIEIDDSGNLAVKVGSTAITASTTGDNFGCTKSDEIEIISSTKVSMAGIAGAKVVIELVEGVMLIGMAAQKELQDKVHGLYGNFNDDETDDLTTPDGTKIASDASDRTIYTDFGLEWRTTQLIFFDAAPTDTDFVPIFGDELTISDAAKTACADVPEAEKANCEFDVTVTGLDSYATVAKESVAFEETQSQETETFQGNEDAVKELQDGAASVAAAAMFVVFNLIFVMLF